MQYRSQSEGWWPTYYEQVFLNPLCINHRLPPACYGNGATAGAEHLSQNPPYTRSTREFLRARTFTTPYNDLVEFSLVPQRRILETCQSRDNIHGQTLTLEERDILYHTFEVVARSLRMAIPRIPHRSSDFVDLQRPIIILKTEPPLLRHIQKVRTQFNHYSRSIPHTHDTHTGAHRQLSAGGPTPAIGTCTAPPTQHSYS